MWSQAQPWDQRVDLIYVVLNGRSDYQVLHFLCLKQDLGIQTHFHLIL